MKKDLKLEHILNTLNVKGNSNQSIIPKEHQVSITHGSQVCDLLHVYQIGPSCREEKKFDLKITKL